VGKPGPARHLPHGPGCEAGDEALYRHHLGVHEELRRRDVELERELDETIRIRNQVDHLEQAAELARGALGQARFVALSEGALLHWQDVHQRFRAAAHDASREMQPLLVRLLWPLVRDDRLARLRQAFATAAPVAEYFGIDLPSATPGDASIPLYIEAGDRLGRAICLAEAALQYREGLAELRERRRPEIVAAERMQLIEDVSANSRRLWEVWLRLQPGKLGPEQRQDLGRCGAENDQTGR